MAGLHRLQTLLSYLVLHCTTPQPRRQVAFLLWSDHTEGQAHTNLRNLLFRLRKVVPNADTFLYADDQILRWRLDSPFTLDVADFEQAITLADQTSNNDTKRAALEQAVGCYHGDLLPDCFDDWIHPERERLKQVFHGALYQLIRLLERQRDYQTAIAYTQRLLQEDQLKESIHRRLIRLHALNDDRASALRVYHACAEALQRELGVEPTHETRELYERLIRQDAHLVVRPAANLGGLTSLVGRDHEWNQLQTAWQRSVIGRPHMVLIVGEAGIGKTRLGQELVVWTQRQGIICASARCYAAEGGLAYTAIATWLQTSAIRATLPMLGSIWRTEVARLVSDLLAEEPDLASPSPMTEPWQRQRFFEALARAILGNRQPRLLVLDDLQWCDQETLEWLHYLLRFDPQAPLLIVATVRPEDLSQTHPLMTLSAVLRRDERFIEIALPPLDESATATLAAHVAGRELTTDRIAALYQETEGNPLFVVEMVRSGLLEQQELRLDRSERLSAANGSPLPPTVQAVITARLARLSPAAQDLVGLAATVGRAFTFRVLTHAADVGEDAVLRGLDELIQRRIVVEQKAGTYDFCHDKIREAAYLQLNAVRRQFLHRRVAQALEVVYGIEAESNTMSDDNQPGPASHSSTIDYPALAHHWRQAGDVSKTTSYLAEAGEQALQTGAYSEAITLLQQALTLDNSHHSIGPLLTSSATTSPTHGTVLRQACLERQLGEAYFGLGSLKESRAHLEQALTLLGWQLPTARKHLIRAIFLQVARRTIRRIWPLKPVSPSSGERAVLLQAVSALIRLGEIYYLANETEAVFAAVCSAVNFAERIGSSPELARAYANTCVATGLIPHHRLARLYSQMAQNTAQQINNQPALHWVYVATGLHASGVGQWTEAQHLLYQAMQIGEGLGASSQWGESTFMLAQNLYFQGHFAKSAELFATIHAAGCSNNSIAQQIWGLLGQGQNALRMDNVDQASSLLEAAATLLADRIDYSIQVAVLGLLALIYLRQSNFERAQQTAEAAERLIAGIESPTGHYSLEGYAGVAEWYLSRGGQHDDLTHNERADLERATLRACSALRRFARVFPIGEPRLWLCQGQHEWLAGRPVRAQRAWQKSLAAAERLEMPYEQGRAHYEIGRHGSGQERHHHLTRACDIFADLGTSYELSSTQAMLSQSDGTPSPTD